ncbi:MAG: hypothetical protein KDG54_00755, partial [Geminicoccaceae bacterium]|nr:hypothetical protein [Geminicoccaceae bacterium]
DVALRIDIAERLGATLRAASRDAPAFAITPEMTSIAGLGRDDLAKVLPALGFAMKTDGEQVLVRRRRRRGERPRAAPERKREAMRGPAHSPFAVLAELTRKRA